jgi:Ser/Thr protein kinase RdoA (MazF antagonist)
LWANLGGGRGRDPLVRRKSCRCGWTSRTGASHRPCVQARQIDQRSGQFGYVAVERCDARDNRAVVAAEHIRAALRTDWHRVASECTPLPGAMNSAAWLVVEPASRYVAKLVPARHRSRFEAGLLAAERLTSAGIPAGAPVRAASGALTVVMDGRVLGLLRYVPGRPLDSRDLIDQQRWGATLAATHHALAGFHHPGLVRFHWLRPGAAHLSIEPWTRPAVSAAVAAVAKLSVTDLLSYGVLHGDPHPGAFLFDEATDHTGLIDWGRVGVGPLMYDVASAVMYAGGPRTAADLLGGYLEFGHLPPDEVQATLPTMLRFRWAVQADYFAQRIRANDRTGLADPADNWAGLHDARDALAQVDDD